VPGSESASADSRSDRRRDFEQLGTDRPALATPSRQRVSP